MSAGIPPCKVDRSRMSDATGPLAELYRRLSDPDGAVANILKVQSRSPSTLETHSRSRPSLVSGPACFTTSFGQLSDVVVLR